MIKNRGKNVTEIHLDNLILLLSYETPVAWYDPTLPVIYVTNKKWSNTTSKHINTFIERALETHGNDTLRDYVDQSDLNILYKNILQGNTPTEFRIINKEETDRFDDLII